MFFFQVFAIAVVVALIIKKPRNSEHENKDHEKTIVDRHMLQSKGDTGMERNGY